MKNEIEKIKKQRQTKSSRSKPICGTLSYLAECRGLAEKGTARLPAGRIVRRYPAAQ
jgi:hypothetical protein